MKRSKLVTIGLLALSISACKNHRRHPSRSWDDDNYYVRQDDQLGYGRGYGAYPIYFWPGYFYGGNGHIYSQGNTSFRTRSGQVYSGRGYGTTSSKGFVSRGGWGSSAHSSVGS